MATSKPISLQISDIIKWFRLGEIRINKNFQRHAVWTTTAKSYLIDTILNELPIPKIFFRSIINPKTQSSIREVVDGQQRVRAIVEFANDELKLTNRSENFAGKKYSDLEPEDQKIFLGYTLSVEQLLNATDDDVIDVFARLNSYTVTLNAEEKRHVEFQTNLKFAVRRLSQESSGFWERHGIFSTNQRFRMKDDALMAEIFQIFLEGICDGGAQKVNQFYKRLTDEEFPEQIQNEVINKIKSSFLFLDQKLGNEIDGEFSKHYHILILIAAYGHINFGIPAGQIENYPNRGKLAPLEKIKDGLAVLERSLQKDDANDPNYEFVKACKSSTQRIASRKVRFRELFKIFSG